MDLGKTQFLSLTAKAITTFLGLVQGILIYRLLSPADLGITGLVLSIGGIVGVAQNLGIVDGAIREIAVQKEKKDIGRLVWVSHLTRQIVTIPVSLGLILLAGFIASHVYHRPLIGPFIQLYAGVLVLLGLQEVLGATLTGMKSFVALYSIQIITAIINIGVFWSFIHAWHLTGYFWAIIVTTSIMVVLLFTRVRRDLKDDLPIPTRADILRLSRRIMHISFFTYVARLLFALWQQLPFLLLARILSDTQLGYLNLSTSFGYRLTIIAAALSEVNLSWMSSLFATEQAHFKAVAEHTMRRIFVLMSMLAIVLIFFTPEIILVVGRKYEPAAPLILIMTAAFFLYTLVDIASSSLFVAANESRLRTLAYAVLTAGTSVPLLILFYTRHASPMLAAGAVLFGSALAYATVVALAYRRFKVSFLTPALALFLAALAASICWLLLSPPGFWLRFLVALALALYVLWESHQKQLLPTQHIINTWKTKRATVAQASLRIICFAGATYAQPSWTNRQHMMSRVSERYPVLYIEPRRWIGRVILHHWKNPRELLSLCKRIFWYQQPKDHLYVKAQLNLIPGSREVKAIARFNHFLNRLNIQLWSWWLGFGRGRQCVWIYDTEAAEYLSLFRQAVVLYDCVDDHAVQAGADRNPQRVKEEEDLILKRAALVTVTSQRLLDLKKDRNQNTHLILNAGDTRLFSEPYRWPDIAWPAIHPPVLGMVGALDSYKVDFELLYRVAQKRKNWQFVFIGRPVVDQKQSQLIRLKTLSNVHFLGVVPHEAVPAYVHHFDVCLIPYKANAYNEASFPLKFWEFMASGKPVVVSGLPELRQFAPLIQYISSEVELIQGIEASLAQPTKGQQARQILAREHSWERRVEQVLFLLEKL